MSEVCEMLIHGRKETIELPSVLGSTQTASEWMTVRRPQIVHFLEKNLFGELPPLPEKIWFETTRIKANVFDGLGERRDVTLHFANRGKELCAKALWYLPYGAKEHIPLVVGLNFKGNAACTQDDDVEPTPGEEPGSQAGRWQIPYLLKEGFSLITAARNDFFYDDNAGRSKSIFKLFHDEKNLTPANREFTAISAWAWGYSRLLELGLTEDRIDPHCIWAHGHSRLGKTALWCGAHDARFAGVVSNCSGCCGAALSRDKHPQGESVKAITTTFPWWFTAKINQWQESVSEMPFDQHFLAALTAPRPVLIASATEDVWADPFNEFRCAQALAPVYRLFGAKGLDDAHFPKPEHPIFGDGVGYYLRTGNHDVKAADWQYAVEFIRRNRGVKFP